MSRAPACPRLAVGWAALKDAPRRQRGGLTAVLDRGPAHGHRDVRPGRRNSPFQPNKETSPAMMPRLLLHNLTDTTAQRLAFQEMLNAIRSAAERIDRLDAALLEIVPGWTMAPVVAAFQALRGVGFLTATILVAEAGDLRRFDHPRQLMAFLGLVPSEHSTGETRQRGGITKTGNTHARKAPDRSRLDLSAPGQDRRPASAAPGRSARERPRHCLEGASPVVRSVSAPDGQRQKGNGGDSCHCARDRSLSVGYCASGRTGPGGCLMTQI